MLFGAISAFRVAHQWCQIGFGVYDYFVVYAYTTPAGISYERRSARVRKSLADRWRKRAEIPVYFDPEHPERAERMFTSAARRTPALLPDSSEHPGASKAAR